MLERRYSRVRMRLTAFTFGVYSNSISRSTGLFQRVCAAEDLSFSVALRRRYRYYFYKFGQAGN